MWWGTYTEVLIVTRKPYLSKQLLRTQESQKATYINKPRWVIFAISETSYGFLHAGVYKIINVYYNAGSFAAATEGKESSVSLPKVFHQE